MPDFPPPPIGITKLSELIIDVHKDWFAYRIANIGIPIIIGDALRKGTRLTMDEIPDGESDHFLVAQGIGVNPSYRLLNPVDIPNLDASKIITGTFHIDRIPDLDASKIASGILALARIPNIDWTRISANFPRTIAELLSDHDLAHHPLSIIPTMDDAHIPDVETLSYTNPFAVAQIPNLDASKITTGRFPLARIPDGTLNYLLVAQGAGSDPVYTLLTDSMVAAANKDGAAGTPCLRTLGTGALQAAAGNHTHSLLEDVKGSATWATLTTTSVSAYYVSLSVPADGDVDLASVTLAFASISRAVAVGWGHCSSSAAALKLRLYMGGVQVAESNYIHDIRSENYILVGTRVLPGSQICKIGVHNYSPTAQSLYVYGRTSTSYRAVGIGVGSVKI